RSRSSRSFSLAQFPRPPESIKGVEPHLEYTLGGAGPSRAGARRRAEVPSIVAQRSTARMRLAQQKSPAEAELSCTLNPRGLRRITMPEAKPQPDPSL